MRKYLVLFFIMILSVLTCAGCKALEGNGDDNGNDVINVVGTWIFTNVLQSDENASHTRRFTLAGDENSGTVTESISPTTGTYTVTGTQFIMNLTNQDPLHFWTYEYEGTIIDNDNMSGTSKTTTYTPDGVEVEAVFDYNFTAERQQ
ncbi:MAG: hypothetical protein KAW12_06415 [Candidatus Aminicenantes bacterium]|nr:hypothetical protein [Candidatus Aminicenantes bacterium]